MGEFGFEIGYGEPTPPPRVNPQEELANVFRGINDAANSHRHGFAHAVCVAPIASALDLGLVCGLLRRELAVGAVPVAKFARRSDKKNYLGAAESDDLFIRTVVNRFRRLRFLDGTPYEEIVLLSGRDKRIVLAERRTPAGMAGAGQVLIAYAVVVAEPEGAVRNGRLSASLRNWVDGPLELSAPLFKNRF
ncbi:hypothetical protein [Actinoplanes sp. HUAS TT8]|uniref:hypothetical protein n=1 Tax=Actinoplanes sp. HUAS TT8 TaxID=3447453 RepID=UPI003F525F28